MLLLEPVVLLLKNTKTDKYHPIVYQLSPPPHSEKSESPKRWKSKGHTTDGFELNEAKETANKYLKALHNGGSNPIHYSFDNIAEWNGEDVPASVCFFNVSEFKLYSGKE